MATSAHHMKGIFPQSEQSTALCIESKRSAFCALLRQRLESLCAGLGGRAPGGEPCSASPGAHEAGFLRTVALPWQPRMRTDGCPTVLDEPGCAWLRAFPTPNPHAWGPAVHFSVPSFSQGNFWCTFRSSRRR